MDIQEFIKSFADQFEDISINKLIPETRFRELDEWSSLVALSVLAMIDEEYDVQIKGVEMRTANTIQDLFELVKSKL